LRQSPSFFSISYKPIEFSAQAAMAWIYFL